MFSGQYAYCIAYTNLFYLFGRGCGLEVGYDGGKDGGPGPVLSDEGVFIERILLSGVIFYYLSSAIQYSDQRFYVILVNKLTRKTIILIQN